jgi:AraC family transcriptional regulator
MNERAPVELQTGHRASTGHIQVVQHRFTDPPANRALRPDCFHLELCLTPQHRGARGNFPGFWSSRRYEPMGSMFIAAPDTELLIRSDECRPITSLVCELKPDAIMQWFDAQPAVTDRLLRASLDIRNLGLRQLLLRLTAEIREPGFASHFVVDALSAQLVIELFRHGLSVGALPAHGGLAPWQLRAIDACLREVRAAPTLASLAELCRIAVRQLTRSFRASRGCSLGASVAERQLEHAKQLLASGESVATVARRLGFSSSSNFCCAFRRVVGLSPGAFRKRAV